ncbi:unnamed protein product, partial [Polarella glacialis]
MEKPIASLPLCYDIANFDELDGYVASREIGNLLQQKGFCFIRGSADEASKKLAEQEAAALKDAGELTRTPIEAVDAFYGEATSCWTYSLSSPEEPAPRRETGLRAVDRFLERIGTCVVSGSQEYLKADILGRSHGLLHHSRCAEDGPAPALVDPQLAAEYVARAAGRKVVLLYYLGPNPAVLSIAQRDDVRKVFQVPIKADCVLAYSSTDLSNRSRPWLLYNWANLPLLTHCSRCWSPSCRCFAVVALDKKRRSSNRSRCALVEIRAGASIPVSVLIIARVQQGQTRVKIFHYNLCLTLQVHGVARSSIFHSPMTRGEGRNFPTAGQKGGDGPRDGYDGKGGSSEEVRFSQTLAALAKNSGPGVFTSLLGRLARERRWWDVDAIFAEMQVRGIKPNRIHINAAINVFAKARRPQKAEEWLIWMQEQDLKPNEVSYNSVINACAQSGYVERAEMWLGRMLEGGIEANEVSYNSVINACAQKGRVSRAEMWLEKMLSAGVKTDAFSYNSVINACAQRRDIERAETWLERMLADGLHADEVSYSSVIKACVHKGELDLAGYWLERMAAANLTANE